MSGTTPTPSNPAETHLQATAAAGLVSDLSGMAGSIGADFLRAVMLARVSAGAGGPAPPLVVVGAAIAGRLDLRGAKIPEVTQFRRCTFDDHIAANDLRCGTLTLDDCTLRGGLAFDRAKAEGSMLLRRCRIWGMLRGIAASVAGDLDLQEARLRAPQRAEFDRIQVGGSLFLRGFSCSKGLSLHSARIGGDLLAQRAVFAARSDHAIVLRHATVGGGVEFWCALMLSSAAVAVEALGLRAGAQISFERARIRGRLNLTASRSGLNLSLMELQITALGSAPKVGNFAVMADSASVGGHVRMEGACIHGGVLLHSAEVKGRLNLSGALLEAGSGHALSADSASFGGNVDMRPRRGRREVPVAPVEIIGDVWFGSAQIGHSLLIEKARFQPGDTPPTRTPAAGEPRAAISFNRMRVGATVQLIEVDFGQQIVSLANTRAGSLVDDPDSWRTASGFMLNGFEYGLLVGKAPTDWRDRRAWLRKQHDEDTRRHPKPQPFDHLVGVLRRMGHEGDARMIGISRRRMQRRSRSWFSPIRWGSWLLDATSGYGYRPWLAIVWILALAVLSARLFHLERDEFVPARDRVAAEQWMKDRQLPAGYPAFDPVLYAADLAIPFGNLGQKEYWAPVRPPIASCPSDCVRWAGRGLFGWLPDLGPTASWPFGGPFSPPGGSTCLRWVGQVLLGWLVDIPQAGACSLSYFWRPVHTLLGWALATIFVGAVTGLIKRD